MLRTGVSTTTLTQRTLRNQGSAARDLQRLNRRRRRGADCERVRCDLRPPGLIAGLVAGLTPGPVRERRDAAQERRPQHVHDFDRARQRWRRWVRARACLTLSGGDGTATQTGSFGGTGARTRRLQPRGCGTWRRVRVSPGSVELFERHRLDCPGATVPIAVGATTTLDGGVVTGPGTLLVDGTLVWAFGTQSGSGETRIAAGGTLVRAGVLHRRRCQSAHCATRARRPSLGSARSSPGPAPGS